VKIRFLSHFIASTSMRVDRAAGNKRPETENLWFNPHLKLSHLDVLMMKRQQIHKQQQNS
jgi:hypothetical protein